MTLDLERLLAEPAGPQHDDPRHDLNAYAADSRNSLADRVRALRRLDEIMGTFDTATGTDQEIVTKFVKDTYTYFGDDAVVYFKHIESRVRGDR